jgi:hypothetical protein
MRSSVLSLALSNLVVFECLQLGWDINAVEPGNIAADDLLLGLICEINSILLFSLDEHKVAYQLLYFCISFSPLSLVSRLGRHKCGVSALLLGTKLQYL